MIVLDWQPGVQRQYMSSDNHCQLRRVNIDLGQAMCRATEQASTGKMKKEPERSHGVFAPVTHATIAGSSIPLYHEDPIMLQVVPKLPAQPGGRILIGV